MRQVNRVVLCGTPLAPPVYSHENRRERFYVFPMETVRLSGMADKLNVILRESMLEQLRPSRAGLLRVEGELRSFNNRSGAGSRLVITVFARAISPAEEPEWENAVELEGVLCRLPVHRFTPLGREITDLMLAVPRPYGRSDYLPCIAWGQNARLAAEWSSGARIHIAGRLQSREYLKDLGGVTQKRVAYEVSVAELERVAE